MKIAILDDYQDAIRRLKAFEKMSGYDVTIYNDSLSNVDALARRLADSEALVLLRERTSVTDALLARLPKLKVISQTGGGMGHIDQAACQRHGVTVLAGTGSPYAAAELTWGLVLAAMRHIPEEVANLKAGRWQRTLGMMLRGRTLGIFGYGKIGQLVAGYGKVFGMHVLVWGRESTMQRASEAGIEVAKSKKDFFERADVLTLHLRLNDDCRGIVTADDLARMKPDSLLVNTSRAQLIFPGALEEALKAGQPGQAAIDVFDEEPLIYHPMLDLPNLLATPHLGWVVRERYELYFGEAFDNLLTYIDDQSFKNLSD